jgi:hypothetical protein
VPATGAVAASTAVMQPTLDDDVWATDDWDASSDEWDSIVSELVEDSEETDAAIV